MKSKLIQDIEKQTESRKIYIYGAGLYGRMTALFFQQNNIDIEAFIVTSDNESKEVLNKEVISIEQYGLMRSSQKDVHANDMIIIAVSDKYSGQIKEQLKEKQIENYEVLSQTDIEYIEKNIKFENNNIVPHKNIAVLMYHRVIDNGYNFWQLNCSPRMFEKHIKFISENYKVLRLEDDWSQVVEQDEKYIVITFDDGYVDNYKYALPILEKYKVPATVFVSTDLIDTKDMYWWDELEKVFIIDEYEGNFFFEQKKYEISNYENRKNACTKIRNYLKNLSPDCRNMKMQELRKSLGVKKVYTEELRCVNCKELNEMAESEYITIGCHTKSHLSMGEDKSKELLEVEVKESKKILEEYIGKSITTFAYPFGGDEDRCTLAEEIILNNDIEKIVVVKEGNVGLPYRNNCIPRHMMFESDNIEKKLNKIWGIYG